MQIGEAFVAVRPDTKKFAGELTRDVEGAGRTAANKLRDVLTFGVAVAGAQKLTSAASGLQQSVGATAAVFGEQSAAIDEFAASSAEAVGLSERAARESTAKIGALLSGFGYATDEAAAKSIELTELGADLAATFGGTVPEAVDATAAALRGETDPIERYGISIRQVAVNAEAVRLGLVAAGEEVDAHAKAQATLSLIMEQSAGAQGQFARETDTAAGQQAIATAKSEDAAASLGENLLPIYTRLAEVVGQVADVFGAMPAPVQTGVIALTGIALLSGPIGSVVDGVKGLGTVISSIPQKGSALLSFLDRNKTALAGVGTALGVAAAAYVIWQDKQAQESAAAQEFIDTLDEATGALTEHTDALLTDRLASAGLGDEVAALPGGITAFTEAIQGSDAAYQTYFENIYQSSDANADLLGILDDARDAYTENKTKLDNLNAVQGSATDDTNALADAFKTSGKNAEDAADKLGSYRDQVQGIIDDNLSVEEAQDNYQRALAALNESLKENGPIIDGNSEAALANRDAFREVVEAGGELTTAMEENGDSTTDLEANLFLQQVALGHTATSWGLTEDAARRYIAALEEVDAATEMLGSKTVDFGDKGRINTGAVVDAGTRPRAAGRSALDRVASRGGVTVVNNFQDIPAEVALTAAMQRMEYQLNGRDA